MVRNGLGPSSRHFTVAFTQNGKEVRSYNRSSDGGDTSETVGPQGSGGWLKIERNGDKFRAYYKAETTSDDQKMFYQMFAEATVSMGANVHVGVAICSTNSNLVSANFERFTLKVSCAWTTVKLQTCPPLIAHKQHIDSLLRYPHRSP